MALKKIKPTNASRRGTVLVDHKQTVTTSAPKRSLTKVLKKAAGRTHGKVATRHRGGAVKQRYRIVDFRREIRNVPGTIKTIEYDPNRNAYISLVIYHNGQQAYILAPEGIQVGMKVMAGEEASVEVGNSLPLKRIPVGMSIHNIELSPGSGGVMARSAGQSATLMGFDEKGRAQIKLPSKEIRLVNSNCYATIGSLSNPDHKNISLGKAGRRRWKGIRPTVRGMVMPPSEHPHGGGEAKGVIGHVAKDVWGNVRGMKTRRKKNKFNNLRLVTRKGEKVKQK